jgi:hypothetical protein
MVNTFMNRLSLRLIIIMTVIILIAEMVILIPSLSRFHHNEMLIEARRQLYLHQVAVLHGEQGFASEISPKADKPRITLTDKSGQAITAYYNATDPSPMPPHRSSLNIGVAVSGLMGWQDQPYAMDFTLEELCTDDEDLIKLGDNIAKIGKINHDMRNILSSAVLVSDNLTNSKDPKVARAAPLVNGASDRAITL